MPNLTPDTRGRILRAADAVFASDGLRAGSMDRIAAHAGVTKRTLYYHFRSKDDLIAACLSERGTPLADRICNLSGGDALSVGDCIRRILEELAEAAEQPRWSGCGFLRAAFELAELPGHPARALAARHKRSLEARLAEQIGFEGLSDPEARARRLMLVLDGTVAQLLVHKDAAYAVQAGELVRLILGHSGARAPRRLGAAEADGGAEQKVSEGAAHPPGNHAYGEARRTHLPSGDPN